MNKKFIFILCSIILSGCFFSLSVFSENLPSNNAKKEAMKLSFEAQPLLDKGEYDKAISLLQKSVKLNPSSTFSHNQLALAYVKKEMKSEALQEFREVLKLDPDDYFAKTWVGMLSQRPVKRKKVEKKLTPLEVAAIEEEKQMLSKLKKGDNRLSYQIERIVIDPGHGGFDSGAVGPSGVKEKDLTLDIARRLFDLFSKTTDIKVFLTRRGDYYLPLGERTAIANQYSADLFLSIHINANERQEPSGTESYYCSESASSKEAERVAMMENAVAKDEEAFNDNENYVDIEKILFKFERKKYWEDSAQFAGLIQDGLQKSLKLRSRGVKFANFFVLRDARMPSILIEAGFISNPSEEKLLNTSAFRQEVADAIYKKIEEYLKRTD